LGTRLRRAKDGTRFGLESADVELNEVHRFVVESRCFSQVSGIVDANLPVALHASKFGRENPYGLDERPRSDRQSKKNDACNWLKHQTMTPNVPVQRPRVVACALAVYP